MSPQRGGTRQRLLNLAHGHEHSTTEESSQHPAEAA